MKENKQELHDDIVEELNVFYKSEDYDNAKLRKKYDKRLNQSVGNIEFYEYGTICVGYNKNGEEIVDSDILDKHDIYSVNIGSGSIDTTDQCISELLSMVAQINERLKRIEKKIGE